MIGVAGDLSDDVRQEGHDHHFKGRLLHGTEPVADDGGCIVEQFWSPTEIFLVEKRRLAGRDSAKDGTDTASQDLMTEIYGLLCVGIVGLLV